jgi:hypothetical protein
MSHLVVLVDICDEVAVGGENEFGMINEVVP